MLKQKGLYVHFMGRTLKKSKIVHVTVRAARIHVRYPYVMEVLYGQQWDETILIGAHGHLAPITWRHEREEYIVKLRTQQEALEWSKAWSNARVTVIDKF